MSEDQTRKARQRTKRRFASKRFVAPDNIPEGQAWISAPPKMKRDYSDAESPPPQNASLDPYEQAGIVPQQPRYPQPGQNPYGQPGIPQPGIPQPGMQKPGIPQPMQHPAMQRPGMQQPGLQKPGIPQSGMQHPAMQKPGMQQPNMQQPVQRPAMQQPNMQQPVQHPAMQKPGMQQPMQRPAMQQPGMQQPVQRPAMQKPGMQQPVQHPAMQKPGMQQPVQRPAMQQPGMQQPAMHQYGQHSISQPGVHFPQPGSQPAQGAYGLSGLTAGQQSTRPGNPGMQAARPNSPGYGQPGTMPTGPHGASQPGQNQQPGIMQAGQQGAPQSAQKPYVQPGVIQAGSQGAHQPAQIIHTHPGTIVPDSQQHSKSGPILYAQPEMPERQSAQGIQGGMPQAQPGSAIVQAGWEPNACGQPGMMQPGQAAQPGMMQAGQTPHQQPILPPERQGVPHQAPDPLNQQPVPPGRNPFTPGPIIAGQQANLPGPNPSVSPTQGQAAPSTSENSGGVRKSGSFRKLSGTIRKARRVTKNWYWPDVDEDSDNREGILRPDVMIYSLSQPLGLLEKNAAGSDTAACDETKKSAFARAIQDYDVTKPQTKEESEQFAHVASEMSGTSIVTDVEARTALDRLARSLSIKAANRELLELSPRVVPLIKANEDVLQDFVELCRAGERGLVSAHSIIKLFEQLNRLYDAPVLPARRDLAVEHFLRAATVALTAGQRALLTKLQLCEHILLHNCPEHAAELLLSVLTSRRVNTEELAILAFKFDPERSKNTVRVLRDSLEPEPGMRNKENILKQNYFSHLFSSIAINAALQASNPKARYARKRGRDLTYQVEEEEVKPGAFRVVSSAMREFPGLSYDEMSWVNRQFAGQQLCGYLPERLIY